MNVSERKDLLVNASATGAAKLIQNGGRYVLNVVGTFGGATLQAQILGPDGVTFINHGTALAAAGSVEVPLPAGSNVRMNVSGGAPSGLYADAVRITDN